MSGVAITSALSGVAPTVRPKDPLEKLLPGPLSSYREFPPIDEIAFFAEVYDNTGSQPHKVEIVGHGQGRRRPDGVRDQGRARQLRAEGVGGRLRIYRRAFRSSRWRRASTCLRVEAMSQLRRSSDGGARNRLPRAARRPRRPDVRLLPRCADVAPVQIIATDMMSSVEQPRRRWRARRRSGPRCGASTPATSRRPRSISDRQPWSRCSSVRECRPAIRWRSSGPVARATRWSCEWAERRPGRGDIAAQVMTSPAQIVAIPKFAGEIRFEKVDPN